MRALWWLEAQERHRKHTGWTHPIVVFVLVLVSVVLAMIRLSDLLLPPTSPGPAVSSIYAGLLGGYVAILLLLRLATMGNCALYEFLWACNVSMVLAVISIATHRTVLTGAALLAVAVDQVMWYVDVAGYAVTGRFVIGVAKYLTWPETSWARRLTSTHHLWFIPFCIAATGRIPLLSYPLSVVYIGMLDTLCRVVTPFTVPLSGVEDGGEGERRYLNVNLVYELWKDIKFEWLQHSHPSAPVHLTRLVVLWSLLNLPFAALLIPLSHYTSSSSPKA